jgi:hypothetical protein
MKQTTYKKLTLFNFLIILNELWARGAMDSTTGFGMETSSGFFTIPATQQELYEETG